MVGADPAGDAGHVVGERAPPQLGLVSDEHDQVVCGVGQAGDVDGRGGPFDDALAVDQAHERAGDREVEEVLGFDRADLVGYEVVAYVAGCGAGCLASIVPALEGRQHDRVLEGGLLVPVEVWCGRRNAHWPRGYR